MSIVMNEYEWAEHMINNHDLGKKPSETLSRVAKYYLATGYSKRETRQMLDIFLLQCDPQASLPKWSDMLDNVVKNAGKHRIILVDGVNVSENELKRIDALTGKQMRRLAFTLLCTAKYWDSVSERNDHWVNSPDRELMQMANINTSIKRQSAMFANLKAEGMIRFSKKIDNLNVQITFMEDGGKVLHIHDFRNLGYQYMKYCGGPYFECENCGLVVKAQEPSRGRKQKYCPSCAVEVKTRQSVNAVMRSRNSVQYAS